MPCSAVEYSSRQSAYAKRAGNAPANWRRINGVSRFECVTAPRASSSLGLCSSDEHDPHSRRAAALPAWTFSAGVLPLPLLPSSCSPGFGEGGSSASADARRGGVSADPRIGEEIHVHSEPSDDDSRDGDDSPEDQEAIAAPTTHAENVRL